MSPGRWAQLNRVFLQCLPLGPDACAEVLERTCRGDDAMRAEVEVLLSADRSRSGNPVFSSRNRLQASQDCSRATVALTAARRRAASWGDIVCTSCWEGEDAERSIGRA